MMIMHGHSNANSSSSGTSPSVKYRPLAIIAPGNNNNGKPTTGPGLWKRLHILKVILAVGLVLTIVNLFNYRFDMKLDKLSFLRNSNNSNLSQQQQPIQNPSSASSLNFGPKRLRPNVELKPHFLQKQHNTLLPPPEGERRQQHSPPASNSTKSRQSKEDNNVTRTIISTNSGKSRLFTNNSTETTTFTSSSSTTSTLDNHPSPSDAAAAAVVHLIQKDHQEATRKRTEGDEDRESVPGKEIEFFFISTSTSFTPRVPKQIAEDSTQKNHQDDKKIPQRPTNDKEEEEDISSSSPTSSLITSNPQSGGNTTELLDDDEELKTDPTLLPATNQTRSNPGHIKFSGYIQTTSSRSVTFLSKLMTKLGINACPEDPPDLHGPLEVNLTKDTVAEVEQRLRPFLLPGGWYRPIECNAKDRVAIIIPFRDREEHLPILLKNLHPMLMRQQVNYGIFVVEETKADPFNRASLMNVGFLEANKMDNWDCFIFHDVDLIPLDDRNLYRCPEQPRHMSVAIDVFDYKLPYFTIFGGVSALTKQQFHSVNGFSNFFWGWGGEDDDMSNRIRFMGYHISRYPMNIARYTMLSHAKAKPNPKRYEKLSNGLKRYENDGLNSVKYQLVDNKKFPLFTWLLVKLQPESIAGKLEATALDEHNFIKFLILALLVTLLICIAKALC